MAYLSICLYCMLQLGYLILLENRRRNVRFGQERFFMRILIILFLSFIADIVSSLNQGPEWFFSIAASGVYLEIILNTLLLPTFFSYVCEQIDGLDVRLYKKLFVLIWLLTIVCIGLILSTSITGKIFYFDMERNYHRGTLFMVPMLLQFVMMILVEGLILSQKAKIERNYYRSLVLFLLPPLIGWALQSFVFGVPFALLGLTFGAQVVFTNIQNRNIDKDYLTGAFNRQTLDRYVQKKINSSSEHKSFSAIMLDIDDFKEINDQYGHYQGDVAIVDSVKVLRNAADHKDFIARYGGDEFCLILDSDDPLDVENLIQRIAVQLKAYNHGSRKFRLSFSMGYAVYHPSFGNYFESFYQIIDQKMYENKKKRREAEQSSNEPFESNHS